MVTAFVRHRGRAVTLARRDVDTDQIIPKQFLKGVERTGYGPALFYDWRYRPDGSPDPAFELNRPAAEGATILITGPNFGCGSSREHAVWALTQYGFRAIVAPSFADIFTANCYRNGLLPVRLAAAEVDALIRSTEGEGEGGSLHEIVVDLDRQLISETRGFSASFTADAYGRELLLRGIDEIGRTLLEEPSIAAYERSHP
jgi:3-isopropylmalate/(R)-2-methylmalate dehydratase small subunit